MTVPSNSNEYVTTNEDVENALSKKEYAKDEVLENIKLYKKIDTYADEQISRKLKEQVKRCCGCNPKFDLKGKR